MPGITVGVDGSETSYRALEWAMKEAAIRQVGLNVLAVHEVAANQWTANPMVTPEDEAVTEQARSWTEESISKIAGQLGGSQPSSISVRAMSGFSAEELIKASANSDLVVVGQRGHGRFAPLVGSTSTKVVHHAKSPVVVVPSDK
jgi:nucleotide-binding universal stress UspA family protein